MRIHSDLPLAPDHDARAAWTAGAGDAPATQEHLAATSATGIDGEYAMLAVAQRQRAHAAPTTATTTPVATTPAPTTAAAPVTRPPQILWTEAGVNATTDAGRRHNGLGDAQAQTNASLAAAVTTPADGAAPALLTLAPADVGVLLQASGIPVERQDPSQWQAAARYINAAADPAAQQERIRRALDAFHIVHTIGHPPLGAQEMKELLWNAANVPGHAFGSMTQAEIAARYQDVAAAMSGAPGRHEVRIGKHVLKFSLDANGQVSDASTKKPGIWGRLLRTVLSVASFVPIPVIAIPARIASAALSAYEGIRNGNWMQALSGIASGVGAGAGWIAGKAVTGAAAITARVADGVARGASSVQAAIDAARARNAYGVFAGIAGAVSSTAGALANGSDALADAARRVQTWANRSLVGANVVYNVDRGEIGAAITGGALLARNIAGDFRHNGQPTPDAALVQCYAGYAADAGRIVTGFERRDIAGALHQASVLATRIDGDFTGTPQSGPGARIAESLDYASHGIAIVQRARRGEIAGVLQDGARLLDDITDGRSNNHGQRPQGAPDLRPGWAQQLSRWLGIGADVLGGRVRIATPPIVMSVAPPSTAAANDAVASAPRTWEQWLQANFASAPTG